MYPVKPNIPVISVSVEDARIILANFTNAGNVSAGINKEFWYGLPLNKDSDDVSSSYQATVTVKHLEDKTVTLNNVIATIPGINLVYKCIYKPKQNILFFIRPENINKSYFTIRSLRTNPICSDRKPPRYIPQRCKPT